MYNYKLDKLLHELDLRTDGRSSEVIERRLEDDSVQPKQLRLAVGPIARNPTLRLGALPDQPILALDLKPFKPFADVEIGRKPSRVVDECDLPAPRRS